MTYPPSRYHGNTGQVSAVLRPGDAAPEISGAAGNETHYLATGASTNGQFGLYRWVMGPNPGGPAPHFHRSISESFYVLSGTIRLFNGTEWIEGTPGDFLYVPEGGIHGFRNESGEPASMLILFAPGAPREHYFETLADAARREAMTEQERTEFFLYHDTYWV